ncbi:uncharacterized protein LOC144130130 [Amblyomma americanum]|uniref:Secreted protein n=1 Tax=Amblyomma americanum TaxID=6943 RepID=A0AAQ4FHY4_AMBAM
MLSQVIVMVCAAVAIVECNVGPNVGSVEPNFGRTGQQAQEPQPHLPSHYTPLLFPPFLFPPSPFHPGLCPPQPCQPQQPYELQGLSSGSPAFIRADDGTLFFVEPKSPLNLGPYVPSPAEYEPEAPVILPLARSGAAAHRGARRGVGGLGRSKRHASLMSGQHPGH